MVTSTLTDRITTFRQRRTAPLILELDLTDGIAEEPPADPLSALATMRRPRLADVLDGLRRAARRRPGPGAGGQGRRAAGSGLAQVQELRAAIREFAGTGKLTVAWAETFGDFSPGNVPYYLATAFDRIYLQPSGDLGLTGIACRTGSTAARWTSWAWSSRSASGASTRARPSGSPSTGSPGRPGRRCSGWPPRSSEQLTGAIAQRLEIGRRGGPGADRPRPVRGRRGAGRRPGGRARLPGRGLRGGPEGGRARTRTCCTSAATSGPGAGRAGPHAARHRPQDAVALIYASGPIRRGRSARGPLCGGSMGSDTVSARAAQRRGRPPGQGDRAAGEQPGRLVRGLGHDLARGGPGPRRRASRSWCRWARWPRPAATSSPWPPTPSSPSPARSPAPSA